MIIRKLLKKNCFMIYMEIPFLNKIDFLKIVLIITIGLLKTEGKSLLPKAFMFFLIISQSESVPAFLLFSTIKL